MPPQPAERKQAAQRHGFVATLVAWYSWWVYRVCKAGLDACEEWSVGVLRESLQISQRAINGASAWTLSGIDNVPAAVCSNACACNASNSTTQLLTVLYLIDADAGLATVHHAEPMQKHPGSIKITSFFPTLCLMIQCSTETTRLS